MYTKNQINQLQGLTKDFKKKIDVLTKLNTQASSKLDFDQMKNLKNIGNDLKKSMKSAESGDINQLNKFIQDHANSNK